MRKDYNLEAILIFFIILYFHKLSHDFLELNIMKRNIVATHPCCCADIRSGINNHDQRAPLQHRLSAETELT